MSRHTKAQDVAPRWFDLFRCFRIASDPVKIWFGAVGFAAVILMLLVSIGLFVGLRAAVGGRRSHDAVQCFRAGNVGGVMVALEEGMRETRADLGGELGRISNSFASADFLPALKEARVLRKVLSWSAIELLLLWIPWSAFAGAISRSAAVEYATGERLGSAEARRFASWKYSSYFWAPIALALVCAALCGVCVLIGLAAAHLLSVAVLLTGIFVALYAFVLLKHKARSVVAGVVACMAILVGTGLVTRLLWGVDLSWFGTFAVVVALPVVLVFALAAVVGFLVLAFGRGLMMSSVSFEGTDTFDAILRSADYVVKKPWHLASYWMVSAAYAVPCLALIGLVVAAACSVALIGVWVGFGAAFGRLYELVWTFGWGATVPEHIIVSVLWVFIAAIVCVAAGWCASLVQSIRAVRYALLRESVDLSGMADIYLDLDQAAAQRATEQPEP